MAKHFILNVHFDKIYGGRSNVPGDGRGLDIPPAGLLAWG